MILKNDSKKWFVLVALISGIIGFSLSMMLSVMFVGMPQPSAIKLMRFEYNPPALVCPGDELNYEIEWNATRSGVMRITPSTHYGLDATGGTAITAKITDLRWTNNVQPLVIMDDPSFVIPDLPPGEYSRALSIGTESESTEPVFLVFPYTIGDWCE